MDAPILIYQDKQEILEEVVPAFRKAFPDAALFLVYKDNGLHLYDVLTAFDMREVFFVEVSLSPLLMQSIRSVASRVVEFDRRQMLGYLHGLKRIRDTALVSRFEESARHFASTYVHIVDEKSGIAYEPSPRERTMIKRALVEFGRTLAKEVADTAPVPQQSLF